MKVEPDKLDRVEKWGYKQKFKMDKTAEVEGVIFIVENLQRFTNS